MKRLVALVSDTYPEPRKFKVLEHGDRSDAASRIPSSAGSKRTFQVEHDRVGATGEIRLNLGKDIVDLYKTF